VGREILNSCFLDELPKSFFVWQFSQGEKPRCKRLSATAGRPPPPGARKEYQAVGDAFRHAVEDSCAYEAGSTTS